ncbi:MAG: dephospho-CoA kinase [Amoebophilaceae bacterium TMED152]|nr:MAG: dephospho-CoA kinase [Amoebophilaceae bacterium TMED152]|tara:strand:- start:332 stop:922 length:591 start_codon:yes stop_codon:yes gene_type:complete
MSYLVGITGGIGSGKTTVSNIFSHLGYKVYNSDERAKYLMQTNDKIIRKITGLLGDTSYSKGKLQKKMISHAIFNNKSLIEKINSIVHPETIKDFNSWVSKNKDSILIKESALIYQSGSYKDLDEVILVEASDEIRIERVLKRDKQKEKDEILKIIQNQKLKNKEDFNPDYILENNGEDLLLPKVIEIIEKLKSKV